MKTIIIIVLIFLFSSFLCADTIYLKDGSKVEGEIKTVSEDEIVINVPVNGFEGIYEPRIIMQVDVSRIERGEIKRGEKPKKPVKVEEKVEGKVKYEGKWVTPEEKEKLEKTAAEEEKEENEEQYAKEVELAKEREAEYKLKRRVEEHTKRLELCKGMTSEQVKNVWGNPDDIRISNGKEQWVYSAYHYYVKSSYISRKRITKFTDFIGYVFFHENGKVEKYINDSGNGGGYFFPENVRKWFIKNKKSPDTMKRRLK